MKYLKISGDYVYGFNNRVQNPLAQDGQHGERTANRLGENEQND
jgi:hypothetical protein